MNEELQRLMDEYRAAEARWQVARKTRREAEQAYEDSVGPEQEAKSLRQGAEADLLAFVRANPPALGPYPEVEGCFNCGATVVHHCEEPEDEVTA